MGALWVSRGCLEGVRRLSGNVQNFVEVTTGEVKTGHARTIYVREG